MRRTRKVLLTATWGFIYPTGEADRLKIVNKVNCDLVVFLYSAKEPDQLNLPMRCFADPICDLGVFLYSARERRPTKLLIKCFADLIRSRRTEGK